MKNIKMKRMGAAIIAACMLTGFVLPVRAASETKETKPKYNVTQLLVKYKDPQKINETETRVKTKVGGKMKGSKKFSDKLDKYKLVTADSEKSMDTVITALEEDSNVEYVTPDYKMELYSADPLFKQQWALSGSGEEVQISLDTVNAWEMSKGTDAEVAVIDTGIDINHEDLKNNIDPRGYNILNNSGDVYSSASKDAHGTEVAGIIAAGINGLGIEGVAPEAKILPIKVSDGTEMYTSDVIKAIEYAEGLGIKIVNMSFGTSDYNIALKDVMADSNMLFICAAGNDNSATYPASFGLDNIIAVGSVNKAGEISSFSSAGTYCDVYAPGEEILTTIPGNKYQTVSGTSFAAPFVAANAALIMSAVPDISVAGLRIALKNGTTLLDDNAVSLTNSNSTLKLALPLKYINDESGLIARAMRYSDKLITPDIAEIITKYGTYSQMDEKQKTTLLTYFEVTDTQMTESEELGLDLINGGILSSIAKQLQISVASAYELSKVYDKTDKLDSEVQNFKSWLDRNMLNENEKAEIYSQMLGGKSISELEPAYIVSKVTGILLTSILRIEDSPECTEFAEATENAIFNILAVQYSVDSDQLFNYLMTNNMLPSQFKTIVDDWQSKNNFYAVEGILYTCAFTPASSLTFLGSGLSKYNTNYNGSWSDGLSQIDQITGEMSYSQNLISLSGRNGLDLNLNLNFDGQVNSAGTNVNQPLYNDTLCIITTKSFYDYRYVYDASKSSVSSRSIALYKTDPLWELDDNGDTIYSPNDNGSSIIISEKAVAYASGTYTTNFTDNYYNSIYNLGVGINLGLPVMEKTTTGNYVHMPDGSKYKMASGNLVGMAGYYTGDMCIRIDGKQFTVNGLTSQYELTNANNVDFYFDANGKYLGARDPYGNTIKVYYNANGYIDKIYDTANRYLQFTYNGSGNTNRTVTLTLYDTNATSSQLLYTFNISAGTNTPYLKSITDNMNRTTTFTVSYAAQNYYMNSRAPAAYTRATVNGNYAAKIDKITLPTGLVYNYVYTTAQKNYGLANTKDYLRVKETYSTANASSSTKLNDATYTYSRTVSTANQVFPNTITDTNYMMLDGAKDICKYENYVLRQSSQIDKGGKTLSTTDVTIDTSFSLAPSKIIAKTYNTASSYNTIQTTYSYDNYGHVLTTQTSDLDESGKVIAIEEDIKATYPLLNCKIPYTVTTRIADEGSTDMYQVVTNTVDTANCKLLTSTTGIKKGLSGSVTNQSKTAMAYDTYGNVKSTTTTDLTKKSVNPNNPSSTYDSTQTVTYETKYNIYPTKTVSGTVYDINGKSSQLTSGTAVYDMFGRVTQVTDPLGYVSKSEYNAAGEVVKTTNPDGSYGTVNHDYANRTITETVYDTTGKISGASRTTYDTSGNIVKSERLNKDLKTYNTLEEITYDNFLRVLTDTQYLTEDKTKYNKTTNTYDALCHLTETTVRDQSGNTLASQTTTYEYGQKYKDDTEKYTKVTTKSLLDTGKYYTSITYQDLAGNTVHTEDYGTKDPSATSYGGTNEYSYSSLLTSSGDSKHTTKITQDQTNLTVRTDYGTNSSSTSGYSGLGSQISEKDGNGNTTTYIYDEAGRQIQTKSPFYKDDNCNITYTNSMTLYDADNRVIETRQQKNAIGAAAAYSVVKYTYDKMGRQIMEEHVGDSTNSQYTQWYYDSRGLLVRVYTGLSKPLTINGLDNVTTNGDTSYSVVKYEYDYYGNQISYTDAEGNVERYTYNELTGQMLTQTKANGDVISMEYDNRGNVVKITGTKAGKTTLTQSYTYNLGGQLTSTTDTNGIKTTYTYDEYGNMTSETYTQGVNVIRKEYSNFATGEPEMYKIFVNGEEVYNIWISINDSGDDTSVYSRGNPTVLIYYSYDKNGNLTQKYSEYSFDKELYEYNPSNTVKNASYVYFGYNADNTRWKENYTYRLDGNLTQKDSTTGGNTYKTTYQYDVFNRSQYENYYKNNQPIYADFYYYNDYNNLITSTHTDYETAYGYYHTSYIYDKANRLQNMVKNDEDTGEILSNLKFTYDASGNLLTKQNNGSDWQTYNYDALNRTSSFSDGITGKTTNYTYDISGQRIGKSGNTVLTSIWERGMIALDLPENVSNTTTNKKYINGNGVNEGMSTDNKDENWIDDFVFRISTAQNDTAITGASGKTANIDIVNYDEFGNQNSGKVQTASDNPYGYRGYYQDVESG
ncbi:MAG: S8 family serine peptidase, partial [Clostridiales bacterium]|nr:S8 family serine peptidase [Clostridiales bacterium]